MNILILTGSKLRHHSLYSEFKSKYKNVKCYSEHKIVSSSKQHSKIKKKYFDNISLYTYGSSALL